jgi:hypothetical protein
MRYTYIVIAIIIALSVSYSFQLPDSVDTHKATPIILKKLDEDVKAYYAERMKICKLELLVQAEAYVDSIIVNKIDLNIVKGVQFPQRPIKPEFPKHIILNDTIKAKPILEGEKKIELKR